MEEYGKAVVIGQLIPWTETFNERLLGRDDQLSTVE